MIDTFYLEMEKNSDLIRIAYDYDDIVKNQEVRINECFINP